MEKSKHIQDVYVRYIRMEPRCFYSYFVKQIWRNRQAKRFNHVHKASSWLHWNSTLTSQSLSSRHCAAQISMCMHVGMGGAESIHNKHSDLMQPKSQGRLGSEGPGWPGLTLCTQVLYTAQVSRTIPGGLQPQREAPAPDSLDQTGSRSSPVKEQGCLCSSEHIAQLKNDFRGGKAAEVSVCLLTSGECEKTPRPFFPPACEGSDAWQNKCECSLANLCLGIWCLLPKVRENNAAKLTQS